MSAPASSARTWEAEDYLAAVGHQLADLPAEERSALLEDLALHLESLGAEDDDRSFAVRLGPADAYAAELRAAAGLPPRSVRPRLVGAELRQQVMAALGHPWVGELRRLLTELRPAWWVLRGYLLVLVPCLVPFDAARDFPVPAPMGDHALGVVLVLLAVVGSVALGRRRLPRLVGALVVVGGAALALGAVALWQGAAEDGLTRVSSPPAWFPAEAPRAEGAYPLLSRYGPVTDVLPYAADGTPLTGVLLFDQDGRPLHVGRQEWWADGCVRVLQQPLAADGVPVAFSYPQAYVLDPAGLDRFGTPVSAGQCSAGPPRPAVPLPVFPAPPPGG
jgi:hypothetical protein